MGRVASCFARRETRVTCRDTETPAAPQARAASPSTAAVIKADVLESAGLVIRSVEDYDLVFSSARKP